MLMEPDVLREDEVFLDDLVFIAVHKEKGYKVEFKYFDLYGYDDGSIMIERDAYKREDWGKIPRDLDDGNFYIRLKMDNEEGELIKPIEFVSAEIESNYSIKISTSDGITAEYDFSGASFIEKIRDRFDDFILDKRFLRWEGIELRYVDLRRYKK